MKPTKRIVTRKALWAKTQGRCAYCGKPLPRRGWHRDHVEPLVRYKGARWSFSGANGCVNPAAHRAANIVAACQKCNLDKGSKTLEAWRASLLWARPVVFYFERLRTVDE